MKGELRISVEVPDGADLNLLRHLAHQALVGQCKVLASSALPDQPKEA